MAHKNQSRRTVSASAHEEYEREMTGRGTKGTHLDSQSTSKETLTGKRKKETNRNEKNQNRFV